MKIKEKDILMPIEIKGIKFRNPFYVSSGPVSKSVELLEKAEKYGWGAVSIKLTFDPYPYINKKPRYGWKKEERYLFFTAEKRLVIDEGLKLIEEGRKRTKEIILWANIAYSGNEGIEGWVNMAKKFESAGAHIIELNMCCPNMSFNVERSGIKNLKGPKTGANLGLDAFAVGKITQAVKSNVNIPVFVKLTGEGGNIGEIAKKVVESKADGISNATARLAIPPIDIYTPYKSVCYLQKQHTLACHTGHWIKPIGLREVYEIRKSVGKEPIVLGVGGVENFHDAVEMIMVGADLVGVCTAILIYGFECLFPMIKELKKYMKKMGYKSIKDIQNILQENVVSADKLIIYEGYAKIKKNLVAPCKYNCPANIPSQKYIRTLAEGNIKEAFNQILFDNPLQTLCSYVCPHPCENECVRKKIDKPVAIKELKRFVIEYGKKKNWKIPSVSSLTPKKEDEVAIIGGGPAGLSCAFNLMKAGYKLTIFEKEKILGGIPILAIPKFRLSEEIINLEIEKIRKQGVEIKTETIFGKDFTLKDLQKKFKAIFIGIGVHQDLKLNIKGEESQGVFSALEFLKTIKLEKKPKIGKKIAIIGGGFSAIDAARTCIRLKAKEVFILYRRTKEEMPAGSEEVEIAEREGVKIMYLVTPLEIITEKNKVKAIKMINLVLDEIDSSGRRKPKIVAGTEFILKVDSIITAIGQKIKGDFKNTELKITSKGTFECNQITGATNISGIYIGGDVATGPKNIINAIASGKNAAVAIDKFLSGKKAVLEYSPPLRLILQEEIIKRKGNLFYNKRINTTPITTLKEAISEAQRCLNCGCEVTCGLCEKTCSSMAIKYTDSGFEVDEEKCEGCTMCIQLCPNNNIEIIQKM